MDFDREFADLHFRTLHALTVARMILGQIWPVTLPQEVTPETMPILRDAFARCYTLLEDEPLASMVSEEVIDLIRQGLGLYLFADEQMQFLAQLTTEEETEKLEPGGFRRSAT
ncbi:hypothetical protein BJF83_17400 [Nocardiopsis sp. CNR-923]|uniref:hypothetical protein n=1 Tax=Nocardiopsis sp. CNR-923 TaxID=1904965 RepID=UPI0009668170|nr:hypothetical protein [Nocardiopsis sp. CNR-923]OLT27759.1 hypothetical protein BJF83_17400 [Nocardiopsis sp. CNR-923]